MTASTSLHSSNIRTIPRLPSSRSTSPRGWRRPAREATGRPRDRRPATLHGRASRRPRGAFWNRSPYGPTRSGQRLTAFAVRGAAPQIGWQGTSSMSAHIYVAEDDSDVRTSIAEILREEGYDVREFSNGGETLRALKDGDRPCIVLMDLLMPEMSGQEFLAA